MRETEKPSFLNASCCSVDVVNGAVGFFFAGLVSKDLIECVLKAHSFKKASTSSSVL